MRHYPHLLGIGLLGLLLACGQEHSPEAGAMRFDVNPALLGEVYRDSLRQFAFQPPRDWSPLPDSVIEAFRVKLARDSLAPAASSLQLVQMYFDGSGKNFCSLSRLAVTDDVYESVLADYRRRLPGKFASAKIHEATFYSNGLNITQFMIIAKEQLLFKLLFQPAISEIIQIDYAVSQSSYPRMVRTIESSIGSISTVKLY